MPELRERLPLTLQKSVACPALSQDATICTPSEGARQTEVWKESVSKKKAPLGGWRGSFHSTCCPQPRERETAPDGGRPTWSEPLAACCPLRCQCLSLGPSQPCSNKLCWASGS